MKIFRSCLPAILVAVCVSALAQNTAFNYQGQLGDAGAPANGIYDLRFAIFDDRLNGMPQGPVLTNTATTVSNGLFLATLDFGNQFPGADRWLEIAVRTNGGSAFTVLNPRQMLTPVPYAVFAGAASNVVGTVSLAQLPQGLLTNNQSGVTLGGNFTGVLTGNGGSLTNLSAAGLTGTLGLGQLPGPTVTNQAEWLLFTNQTAYYAGRWYSFSNSTTAGFNEIESISPFITSGGAPSGVRIRLMSGLYPFTTPIILTNETTICGAGDWATLLIYVGPTNLFAPEQVMANVPQNQGLTTSTNLASVGLIQLTTTYYKATAYSGVVPIAHNYNFSGFGITVASNMPVVEIGGAAGSLFQDQIGLFGWNGFKPTGDVNSALRTSTTNSLTIGEAVWSANALTFNNSFVVGLADGVLNVGNSFFSVNCSEFVYIGADQITHPASAAAPNAYPHTNWLSVGCAVYNSVAAYTAMADDLWPVENNLDIWNDGSMQVLDYVPQLSTYDVAIGPDGSLNMPMNVATGENTVMNLNGIFVITNVAYAAAHDPNFTGAIVDSLTSNTSDYSFEQRCNGVAVYDWTAGDPAGNIWGTAPGFYLHVPLYGDLGFATNYNVANLASGGKSSSNQWVGTFTGDGAALTNLNAAQLSGVVPAASLPGITTNVSASGVTFYITNGLIMRVSAP